MIEPTIELAIELAIESLPTPLTDSAGRRAASKTSKSNTVARKVSMIGERFRRWESGLARNSQIEIM